MSLADSYRNKQILVTGGLGFIGSNLAIALVQLGAKVTVVDSLVPEHGGNWFNIEPVKDDLNVNVADMRDLNALNTLVQDREFIFHIAGQVSHGDSMRDPHGDLGVNCVSTMNLVEACRNHNRDAQLVFTSTRQVYGRAKTLPVTEDHTTIPIDVNGINKLAAEYYHLLYDRVYGVRSAVLRLTNTYGPRQQIRNDRQGFIGILIRQALRGEKIKIFGTGEQLRDFNYVDDVVQSLLLAGAGDGCYGKVWNLGAPKRYSLLEFVSILNKLCNVEFELAPFPEDKKIIDIGDYYGDYSAFTSATGWHPKVDLPEGLERTVESYRRHKEVYWA
ncbi:MAG: NAD-dependent epimerase/dehydratase family protein [Planctomycetota bacterium]